jgi:diguanylate cyclase (GGDEF)-like protein
VRDPALVIGRWQSDPDGGTSLSGAPAVSRGPEHRVAALTMAALLFVGGAMGMLNLVLQDVLRPGAPRLLYGAAMGLCMAAALLLAAGRRAGRWEIFGLVLLGDLTYLVVVLSVHDPVRYATPLMLLFPAFVAAWFLGPWELGVNMVVTAGVCLLALSASYDSALGLGIQVCVSAGTLNAGALGVYVLRRRVQKLLVATETLSLVDPLTGLFNRRFLAGQASRVWRQARRDGTRVAAMVLDLDHFKRLNDTHGHATGDSVLRTVARSLSSTVRPTDVLARTGGEELVVLGLVGDPDEAVRLAERLRSAVARSRTPEGHSVTASVGIALTHPSEGEDPAAALWRLIDRADAAMYEAKQQGRDRVAARWVPVARSAPPEECGEAMLRPRPPASDVA